jgi:hypothetical protein
VLIAPRATSVATHSRVRTMLATWSAAMLMVAKVAQVTASAALPTTLVRLVNAVFRTVTSVPRAASPAAMDLIVLTMFA